MSVPTSDQLINVIERVKTERERAERQGWQEDIVVLDEELDELRMAWLKLRWIERMHTKEAA